MNSKTLVFSVTTILSASALFAEPRVDQSAVTLAQDSQSRLVTVGYELTGEPAVITVDFQTNTLANAAGDWVSIGDVNFTNVIGDVNQVVQIGSHAIYWQPDKSWPDQRINDGRVRAVVKAWATNAPPDYCVVCLLTDAQIEEKRTVDVTSWNFPRRRYFVSAEAIPGGVKNDIYKRDFLVLRKIPAAGVVWRMGTTNGTNLHKVMLTRDYYIGIYELTVAQNSAIGGTPGTSVYPQSGVKWSVVRGAVADYPWPGTDENDNPIENHNVSSSSTLGKLRIRTGIDSFDLPTEAQWEYAARSGHGGWTYYGEPTASRQKWAIQIVGWFSNNYNSGNQDSGRRNPVGNKVENDWGLYDVLGNVREWTLDWYASYVIPEDPNEVAVDPIGAVTGTAKVARGGDIYVNLDYSGSLDMRQIDKGYDSGDGVCGCRFVCDAVAK